MPALAARQYCPGPVPPRGSGAAAGIHHDNVVTIYQVAQQENIPFIVMELLEGEALDSRLASKKRLSIFEILRIGRETATGLAAAHKLGLVHRDIKPANLWLESPNGRVKILDFGLARQVEDDVHLTQSGAIIGTPAYMSPEQACGEKVDVRSDLFSLGCVLYRLCTGQSAFQGKNMMAILKAISEKVPTPVYKLNPEVPTALENLIHRLLAKDPAKRFQTAKEVVAAFREIELGSASDTRRFPWIVSSSAAIVGVVLLVLLVLPRNKSTLPIQTDDPNAEGKANRRLEKVQLDKSKDTPVLTTEADRFAAEWVLSIGGTVSIRGKGDIKTSADLPRSTVRLTGVLLNDNKQVSDAGLVHVKDCKNLTAFDLGGTLVSDTGLAHFKYCKNLTSFNLGGTLVSDKGLVHFKDCKNLTAFDLAFTQVGDAGLLHLKDCKSLTSFGLGFTQVTDFGLSYFRDCNLTGLALGGTRVTDEGLALFKDRKHLVHLDLQDTKVSDAGLANFKESKNLTYLDLKQAGRVSDIGLANFKGCKNLTNLQLGDTLVSDMGLECFKDCKNLTVLNLWGTRVSDAGLALLKECKSLRKLHVQKTHVTEAGIAELKKALPQCKIEWNGGVIDATP